MREEMKDYLKAPLTWLPVSSDRKHDFLTQARGVVDKYKPRIEEMVDVDLGEVKVREVGNFYNDALWDTFISNVEVNGELPEEPFGLDLTAKGLFALGGLVSIPFKFYNHTFRDSVYVRDSVIYYPFSVVNRLGDPGLKRRKLELDKEIVKGLSMHLWDKLGGERMGRETSAMRHGFGVYCSEDFFENLYPAGKYSQGEPFREGSSAEKVWEMVNARKNLKLIPEHWREWAS